VRRKEKQTYRISSMLFAPLMQNMVIFSLPCCTSQSCLRAQVHAYDFISQGPVDEQGRLCLWDKDLKIEVMCGVCRQIILFGRLCPWTQAAAFVFGLLLVEYENGR